MTRTVPSSSILSGGCCFNDRSTDASNATCLHLSILPVLFRYSALPSSRASSASLCSLKLSVGKPDASGEQKNDCTKHENHGTTK